MSTPTTFQGEPGGTGGIDWSDSSELLRHGDTGIGFQLKAIRRGSFAELIRFVLHLPQGEQDAYAIQKSGGAGSKSAIYARWRRGPIFQEFDGSRDRVARLRHPTHEAWTLLFACQLFQRPRINGGDGGFKH